MKRNDLIDQERVSRAAYRLWPQAHGPLEMTASTMACLMLPAAASDAQIEETLKAQLVRASRIAAEHGLL